MSQNNMIGQRSARAVWIALILFAGSMVAVATSHAQATEPTAEQTAPPVEEAPPVDAAAPDEPVLRPGGLVGPTGVTGVIRRHERREDYQQEQNLEDLEDLNDAVDREPRQAAGDVERGARERGAAAGRKARR
ncbi:MAG: hypothetical protein ACI8PT_003817 [Gammaproteobacteria bacterium]